MKSIRINGCYSKFIQNTVVPVHFSSRANTTMLFSHITALQPPRRREEYQKHKFELHDQFSDVMNSLLSANKHHLKSISIENSSLDLEMTELFCAIACHSHALESFIYNNNHDKGIQSSGLLQAIVTACPNMQHFRGLHSGMDDAVLATIARHWTLLKSLTLCSLKSRDVLGHAEIMSEGRQLLGSSPTGRISHRILWQLLCKCRQLETLELHDLACISNRDLAGYEGMLMQLLKNELVLKNKKVKCKPYQPYTIPKTTYPHSMLHTPKQRTARPGASVRHLIITKYMTTPLSKPGFESILRLFPQLSCLEYETNFYTFDNLFEGITRDMFHAECDAVHEWCKKQDMLTYVGRWNASVTAEQRLMAGMASVSEGA